MALDLLDNVLCLHLSFETAQGILKGLAFLNTNLCQSGLHLQTCPTGDTSRIMPRGSFAQNYLTRATTVLPTFDRTQVPLFGTEVHTL